MTAKKVAILVGEESGDLLGADLVRGLKARLGPDLELTGVGGAHLQTEGLHTIIDPSELALMGISAIIKRLPQLVWRIRQVAAQIIAAKPDILIIIDSPEFTHRVARKVRAALPNVPVINYVCPSVWAWRPERAKAMTAYIDEVLCVLPFEPNELKRLGGPTGTYVGHRLNTDADVLRVAHIRAQRTGPSGELMLLPGSRSGEIERLLPEMIETAKLNLANGTAKTVTIPTLERHKSLIAAAVSNAGLPCRVLTGSQEKWAAFASADAALAASGTVSLELALCGVPHAAVYRLDYLAKKFIWPRVVTWSGNLPNLIANDVVVPESYEEYFRRGAHSRLLAGLMSTNGPNRIAQLAGFEQIRRILKTDRPTAELAADRVMRYL